MRAPRQLERNPGLSRQPCFAGLMVEQDDGHIARCPDDRLCKGRMRMAIFCVSASAYASSG
jgi:hypothetical protein